MAKQAGVSKKTIYDLHFGRHQQDRQVAALPIAKRFEARKQDGTGTDEFWCVWDTHSNAHAFGGSLTYLTQAVAIERAEELSASYGVPG
jgi:hypothetical protein